MERDPVAIAHSLKLRVDTLVRGERYDGRPQPGVRPFSGLPLCVPHSPMCGISQHAYAAHNGHRVHEVGRFFVSYKCVRGKTFDVLSVHGAGAGGSLGPTGG